MVTRHDPNRTIWLLSLSLVNTWGRKPVLMRLGPRPRDDCPFVDLPNPKASRWGGGVTADEMREMQWVKPELVAQIRFVEWTAEGRLRHAAFLGFRSDKTAREVRREAIESTS